MSGVLQFEGVQLHNVGAYGAGRGDAGQRLPLDRQPARLDGVQFGRGDTQLPALAGERHAAADPRVEIDAVGEGRRLHHIVQLHPLELQHPAHGAVAGQRYPQGFDANPATLDRRLAARKRQGLLVETKGGGDAGDRNDGGDRPDPQRLARRRDQGRQVGESHVTAQSGDLAGRALEIEAGQAQKSVAGDTFHRPVEAAGEPGLPLHRRPQGLRKRRQLGRL
jgi:hypothetical protein